MTTKPSASLAPAEVGNDPRDVTGTDLLFRLEGVSRTYRTDASFFRRHHVDALRSVDLDIFRGEVLTLVGQSGSGKSTLGRIVARLIRASSGRVWFGDTDVNSLRGRALRNYRRRVGIVFQDPYASLNPRMRVGAALAEPLRVWKVVDGRKIDQEVARLLDSVAIPQHYVDRYPHALSGGERQRVAIARALASRPEVLVADEAVSALDVASAAEILNLLLDLHAELRLTVLFATHDLGAARVLADRIAVMQHGEIVEIGPAADILGQATHPYTRELLEAELHLPSSQT
ncbi:MAG TPA: ABC transporter ATP-binding protein [Gaiellaceae bacterium]|jgi:ABC-type glutathione transport system ATPase component